MVVHWLGRCLHRCGSGDGSRATVMAMMVLAPEAAGTVYNEKKNVSKKKPKQKKTHLVTVVVRWP